MQGESEPRWIRSCALDTCHSSGERGRIWAAIQEAADAVPSAALADAESQPQIRTRAPDRRTPPIINSKLGTVIVSSTNVLGSGTDEAVTVAT